jgi:hypothetical protein
MNGYAIFGRPPQFPNARGGAGYISAGKPSRQDMDDIHLSDRLTELIEDEIDNPAGEALMALYDTCGNSDCQPIDKLKAQCDADNLDDWIRLLLRAPVADADIVVLNFRHWAAVHLERKADEYGWTDRAQQLLIEESAE